MRLLFIFLSIVFIQGAIAQDIEYTKQLIKVLSSPEFHGRGYTNKGDEKAAIFIRREMNKAGLKSFDGITYFQPFELAANTFPKAPVLEIDGQKLTPGEDFMLDPHSCGCEGKYKLFMFDSTVYKDSASFLRFLRADHSQEVVVMDYVDEKEKHIRDILKGFVRSNSFNAKAIIQLTEKPPIFTPATFVQNFCSFNIQKEKWPTSAKEVKISVKNKFHKQYTTNNVIGYIKGESDSIIAFSAHYDHVGRLGPKVYFPGANDNASGTAMILDLARHFGAQKKRPKYSYVFMAFSGEESGLIGSSYFVQHPLFPLSQIKVLINLDMVGSGRDGITIVNGAVHKEDFEQFKTLNDEHKLLAEVAPRGRAANSDHYPFSAKGVKAFFIYTRGAYKEYHNIYDQAVDLPLTEYEDLFRLIVKYTEAQ